MDIATLRNQIASPIVSLYGDVDWVQARGLLQVVAIGEASRAFIRIGPEAPHSPTDRFVLGFARARADAIVTTGAILRAEPDLVHRYADDPATEGAFRAWRESVLGNPRPPALVVLSQSGEFPVDHPALRAATSGFVWTSKAGRARLGPSIARLSVDCVDDAASSRTANIAIALATARSRLLAETICFEGGPHASADLDWTRGQSALRVDELLLSQFTGPLPQAALGEPFVSEAAMPAHFPPLQTRTRRDEVSGAWVFERYRNSRNDD